MLLAALPGTLLPLSGFNGLFCSMVMQRPTPLNKVIVMQSSIWLSAAGVCQTVWQFESFRFILFWFSFGEVALNFLRHIKLFLAEYIVKLKSLAVKLFVARLRPHLNRRLNVPETFNVSRVSCEFTPYSAKKYLTLQPRPHDHLNSSSLAWHYTAALISHYNIHVFLPYCRNLHILQICQFI